MTRLDLMGPGLRALEVDAVIDAEYFSRPEVWGNLLGWADPVMSGGLGRPLRRALALQSLGVTERVVARWKQSDACSFDPDSFEREIAQSLSGWNPCGRSYTRIWKDVTHAAANLELTQRILQLKRRQSSSQGNGWLELAGMPSLVCSGAEWGQKINADGTVLVSCDRLPDWLKERRYFSRLPLTYMLRTEK